MCGASALRLVCAVPGYTAYVAAIPAMRLQAVALVADGPPSAYAGVCLCCGKETIVKSQYRRVNKQVTRVSPLTEQLGLTAVNTVLPALYDFALQVPQYPSLFANISMVGVAGMFVSQRSYGCSLAHLSQQRCCWSFQYMHFTFCC